MQCPGRVPDMETYILSQDRRNGLPDDSSIHLPNADRSDRWVRVIPLFKGISTKPSRAMGSTSWTRRGAQGVASLFEASQCPPPTPLHQLVRLVLMLLLVLFPEGLGADVRDEVFFSSVRPDTIIRQKKSQLGNFEKQPKLFTENKK